MARVPNRYIWHKQTSPPGRADGVWSVSYADLMTLLLCFFVVILMVSPPPVPHADKVQSVMASLRSAFSMARDGGRASPARQATLLEQLVAMTENAADNGVAPGRSAAVSVHHESDGIHIRLRSDARPAHTSSDASVLETGAERALRRMAPALRDLNPYIEVRAYAGAAERSGNMTAEVTDRRAFVAMEGAFQRARAVANVLTQC
ncbi:MAG: flagellar motor protein MotB, partial [Phycisphaerae bacterium]